jgi:hypothetical protein
MFSMTIVFGASGVPWTLLFKSEEAFNSAKASYEMSPPGSIIRMNDDYGQQAAIDRNSIHGVLFEDLSKSKLALIERALHQDRVNIEANSMRKADPAILNAMREQAGQRAPGVITPFGLGPNGAFRQ